MGQLIVGTAAKTQKPISVGEISLVSVIVAQLALLFNGMDMAKGALAIKGKS